jgi:hypothetical protein
MEQNTKLLIQLYGQHSLSELNSPEAGRLFMQVLSLSYTDLLKEGWFINNKNTIEEIKRKIENFEKAATGSKDLIIKCLNCVWKECVIKEYDDFRLKERMEIFEELIFATFQNKWSENQMVHFKKVFNIFKDSHSFFLSYTNHSSRSINQKYDPVFSPLIDKAYLTEENRTEKNLLAKAIANQLRERNLRKGFYDLDSIKPGQQIDKRILESVSKSFAFIQLVSTASFTYNSPNYSYEEFTEYYQTHCERISDQLLKDCYENLIFYLILEETLYPPPDEIPDEYEDWISTVKNKKHWFTYNHKNFEDLKRLVDELIVEINRNKSFLVEAVPD